MPRTLVACLTALGLLSGSAPALDVGDPAPPLQVKKWVLNPPLAPNATKGKILVVDFWATWCQPCRQTIPHLNKLFKKFGPQGVVFVGMTEEDEATVAKFAKGVGIDYNVGLDDGGKTNDAYMKGVSGVPHTFVVDAEGRVAWHGHPLTRLEKVIEELVAGKFDLARAKKLAALSAKLAPILRSRDSAKLLEVLDEVIKEVPDDPDAYRLKRALLRDQGKAEEALSVLKAMAKGCPKDPDVLVEVAITLSTTGDMEHRDLPLALELAKQAVAVSGDKVPRPLAALARVHYELGHLTLAAETAAKAAAVAEGEEKKTLEAHAAFYRKEAERRRKDPDAK